MAGANVVARRHFYPSQMSGHIAKYRGKRCDNDEWLIDSGLIYDDEFSNHRASIFDCTTGNFEEVRAGTVSQFTGLHDCDGKEIYELDIIRLRTLVGIVMWHPYMTAFYINADARIPSINSTYATLGEMWQSYRHDITVIGNVFEPQYIGKSYEQILNELNKLRR